MNKKKLAQGGLPQDKPHEGMKGLAKMLDHMERAKKALAKKVAPKKAEAKKKAPVAKKVDAKQAKRRDVLRGRITCLLRADPNGEPQKSALRWPTPSPPRGLPAQVAQRELRRSRGPKL